MNSPLDQQRERIQDDLRGLVAGDVHCDDVFVQLFASDASLFEIKPLGVVRPRSTADVAACVRYAAAKQLPIHARGGGSGAAGLALGRGLVVDFSAYLHRVIRIDPDRVRVQAGAVYQRLNEQLRPSGRLFGPQPADGGISTLGGMAAVDASGSRRLRYGPIRRHVQSLQIVLADGQVLEAGREPLADGVSTSAIPRKRELVDQIVALLKRHADQIRQHQPSDSAGRCGCRLADALGDGYLDLASLVIGSEGALALITEALLATEPLPGCQGVVLLMFDGVEKAARAALDVLAFDPSACELMDRRHLSLARLYDPRFDQWIPSETEAALLVELQGDDPAELREGIHRLTEELWHRKQLAFGARQVFESEEVDAFWRLADRARPAMYRVLKGASRPAAAVDDLFVATELLPDFLVRVQNALKRNHVTASLFCHAGHGQVKIHPFLDLTDPEELQRLRRLNEELFQEAAQVGGKRACGLFRDGLDGPLHDVFVELKRIFDPQNIFNPGKGVGADPDLFLRHLSPPLRKSESAPPADAEPPSPELRNLVELQMNWEPARVLDAAAACNRCGQCRTQSPELRMCPLFRAAPAEEASPRAKANLIRGVLSGALDLNLLGSDAFKSVADLCIHCHCCRLECPSGVDVPRLMREGKGAAVAANGLPLADWAMTRLDLLGALGGLAAPAVNWALANRQMRWFMEKTLGVSQGRKLPRVASRGFLRRAARRHRLARPMRRGAQKVLYFVDVYANHFDPQLAEATLAVLEHNGIAVYVPTDQRQAGMASIACGALDHARRLAAHNVAILAESVRQGCHIVATEPSAALCLRHEYPQLLDEDDARLVAANTSEACDFLWQLHARGQLQLDLRPLNLSLGYHTPCHLLALGEGVSGGGAQLLDLIPGLRVQRIEAGCCGMAGAFGLSHKNFRNSLRAGRKLIARLRDPAIQLGATECSACKMQMEQGAAKPTIHPLKLLALSYGLMPEIARLLNTSGEELIVT